MLRLKRLRWKWRKVLRFCSFIKKQRYLGVKITREQLRLCWSCAAIDLALDKYHAKKRQELPTFWELAYRWIEYGEYSKRD